MKYSDAIFPSAPDGEDAPGRDAQEKEGSMSSTGGGAALPAIPGTGAKRPLKSDDPIDMRLMEAIQSGQDESAFGELMARHALGVFNYLYRFTGDWHLSEDGLQDGFLHVLQHVKTYRKGAPVKPWLFQIARFAAIDIRRRRHGERTNVLGYTRDDDDDPPCGQFADQTSPDAASEFERKEAWQGCVGKLAALEEKYREVLVLRYQEELSYQQIAQVLEVPVSTIEGRIFRAKALLRAEIARSKKKKNVGSL